MRHVIISTIQRGQVNPPEPLDAENQRFVDASIALETAAMTWERDRPLSQWRERALAKAPQGVRVYAPAQRVMMRAMGR
jgi:hypothetical protein